MERDKNMEMAETVQLTKEQNLMELVELLRKRVCKINCVKQHRLFDTPVFLYGKKFSTRLCIIGRNWQTIFLEVNNYVTGF